jgi:hypothetical protein
MFVAERAVFLVTHPLRMFPFVLGGIVVPLLANLTSQGDDVSGHKSSSFKISCF